MYLSTSFLQNMSFVYGTSDYAQDRHSYTMNNLGA